MSSNKPPCFVEKSNENTIDTNLLKALVTENSYIGNENFKRGNLRAKYP